MTIRTSAAAVAAALAIGGIAGTTLFAPQLISAQEDTGADDAATEDTTVDGAPAEHGPRERMEGRLDALAELLGVTADELRTARKDGQSIAEVAEANGVDPQTVIDELTEQARTRLEERLADLPSHIEDFVNGEFEGRGPGVRSPRGPFGDHPHRAPDAEADAEADAGD